MHYLKNALEFLPKMLISRKRNPEEFIAIKPNTDPERFYHDWIGGSRMSLNALPAVQLTILQCDKTADELAELICSQNPYVCHTGHAEESCPGKPLSEGLREIFSGQPSTWEIREARINRSVYTALSFLSLDFLFAQAFEGNEPGNPNRDFCDIHFNRFLAPMELELRIPHYGVRDGYCEVVYLKVNLRIDPLKGILVTGHKDGMGLRS